MNPSEQVIDSQASPKQRQPIYQSMSLLAYIGNTLWGILFLILLIACVINGNAVLKTGDPSSYIYFYMVVSAIVVLACVLCILGLLGMKRKRKKGFYLYSIGNIIWVGLLFYNPTNYGWIFPVLAVISGVFTIFFALRLPKYS